MITLGNCQLYEDDCLTIMPFLPDNSVDIVLADLPYGTTACKWDTVIPFEPLWKEYRRVCRGAIILTAANPFSSVLVASNLKDFKYDWIWEKTSATGHLNAKKKPLRAHEQILVFGNDRLYNPQKTSGHVRKTSLAAHKKNCVKTDCYGEHGDTSYDSTDRYPRSVLQFPTDKQTCSLHPTQKPVALMEYLIKTYSNQNDIILDNCMGSGTTGVACVNTARQFIGIEKPGKDKNYFPIACGRIAEAIMTRTGGEV